MAFGGVSARKETGVYDRQPPSPQPSGTSVLENQAYLLGRVLGQGREAEKPGE